MHHNKFAGLASGMNNHRYRDTLEGIDIEKEYDRFSDDEDEGYDEYMREAKEAINRKDKEAFEEMAKDEKKHKETLKRIRKKKSDVDKAKQTIEGESEDEQPENNKH